MAESMVERVARAFGQTRRLYEMHYQPGTPGVAAVHFGGKRIFIGMASDGRALVQMACGRAAIEAMREPNDDMISARFSVIGQGGKAEWEAMIEAALSETEATPTERESA